LVVAGADLGAVGLEKMLKEWKRRNIRNSSGRVRMMPPTAPAAAEDLTGARKAT
jgi:hypothetical protein